MSTLKYNGNGAHIPGVPAQDLSDDDIARLVAGFVFISEDEAITQLTCNGLYSVVKVAPSRPKKQEIETDSNEDDA